jgi:hypothetical protein
VKAAAQPRQDHIIMMTQPGNLSDEDLLDRAHQLRLLALRGHVEARGPAHEHDAKSGADLAVQPR